MPVAEEPAASRNGTADLDVKTHQPLSLGRVLKSLITKWMERYNKWSKWSKKEGSKMLWCDFSIQKSRVILWF